MTMRFSPVRAAVSGPDSQARPPRRRSWGTSAVRLAAWLAWMGLALTGATARACPDCDIGRVARTQFWNDNFGTNLAVALAPFVVIAIVTLWADRLGRPPPHVDREARHG
jgi:hypothetical protein